jgi:hypothetical protein
LPPIEKSSIIFNWGTSSATAYNFTFYTLTLLALGFGKILKFSGKLIHFNLEYADVMMWVSCTRPNFALWKI